MKLFTIMFGGVALAALAGVAMSRNPAPQSPVQAQAAENKFDEAWRDTMKVVELKKADRLKVVTLDPQPVKTEKIEPTVVPPVLVVEEEEPPIVHIHNKPIVHEDICSRHNMKKVITRGGKSWRCRKR